MCPSSWVRATDVAHGSQPGFNPIATRDNPAVITGLPENEAFPHASLERFSGNSFRRTISASPSDPTVRKLRPVLVAQKFVAEATFPELNAPYTRIGSFAERSAQRVIMLRLDVAVVMYVRVSADTPDNEAVGVVGVGGEMDGGEMDGARGDDPPQALATTVASASATTSVMLRI